MRLTRAWQDLLVTFLLVVLLPLGYGLLGLFAGWEEGDSRRDVPEIVVRLAIVMVLGLGPLLALLHSQPEGRVLRVVRRSLLDLLTFAYCGLGLIGLFGLVYSPAAAVLMPFGLFGMWLFYARAKQEDDRTSPGKFAKAILPSVVAVLIAILLLGTLVSVAIALRNDAFVRWSIHIPLALAALVFSASVLSWAGNAIAEIAGPPSTTIRFGLFGKGHVWRLVPLEEGERLIREVLSDKQIDGLRAWTCGDCSLVRFTGTIGEVPVLVVTGLERQLVPVWSIGAFLSRQATTADGRRGWSFYASSRFPHRFQALAASDLPQALADAGLALGGPILAWRCRDCPSVQFAFVDSLGRDCALATQVQIQECDHLWIAGFILSLLKLPQLASDMGARQLGSSPAGSGV
jgi:hypothetical protein